jgi:hypothetical protein
MEVLVPKAKIIEIDYGFDSEEIFSKLEEAGIIVRFDNEANTACYVGGRGVNQKALRQYANKAEGRDDL